MSKNTLLNLDNLFPRRVLSCDPGGNMVHHGMTNCSCLRQDARNLRGRAAELEQTCLGGSRRRTRFTRMPIVSPGAACIGKTALVGGSESSGSLKQATGCIRISCHEFARAASAFDFLRRCGPDLGRAMRDVWLSWTARMRFEGKSGRHPQSVHLRGSTLIVTSRNELELRGRESLPLKGCSMLKLNILSKGSSQLLSTRINPARSRAIVKRSYLALRTDCERWRVV